MLPLPPIVDQASLPFQSLTQIVKAITTGQITSRQLVEQCLHQISRLDGTVKAWVMVDEEGAIKAAKQADDYRKQSKFRRMPFAPTVAIPFGVKDIIDVKGWPTVAGFSPWKERIAEKDAEIVARMRLKGMIPIGKTVTTQFASIDPAETTNPYNPQTTPGGSSSGSCAAVACRMVPVALGSQTGGSINRPASFCGVVGLKMPYNMIPVTGVVPCSPSLDTLGFITPAVGDLAFLTDMFMYKSAVEN
ncbi:MAG: amidase, partial [Isosphaeraceae bacterium]